MMSLVMLGSIMAVIASFFLPVAYIGYRQEDRKLLGMSDSEKRLYLSQNPSPYDLEAEVVEEIPQHHLPKVHDEELGNDEYELGDEELQKKILHLQQLQQQRQYNR